MTQYGGNAGYDDEPSVYYSWDSLVPRHAEVRAGDLVALRDKEVLLGTSVIEEVIVGKGMKDLFRCPECGKGTINFRRTMTPAYVCSMTGGCGAAFDEPVVEPRAVTTYRSRHDAGWTDLYSVLTVPQLKSMCEKPSSQHSIQPIDWSMLMDALGQTESEITLKPLRDRERTLAGGHAAKSVRVRVGQAAFRKRLLERFGCVCAFTGPGPDAALDAAHLYSYAALGEHHETGGLMLRSDVHALFDAGLLAVNPASLLIHVHDSIVGFDAYGPLNGRPLHVKPPPPMKKWLALHWAQHRSVT